MAQQYKPTIWVDNKTVGTADIMNNIEQGIVNTNQEIEQLKSIISNLVNDLKSEVK